MGKRKDALFQNPLDNVANGNAASAALREFAAYSELIIPPDWNRNVKQVLQPPYTTTWGIHTLGASVGAGGSNVGDALTDGYPPQLANQLVADGVPRGGDYMSIQLGSNWSPGLPLSVAPCTFDIAPGAWARRAWKWCAIHAGTGAQTYFHFTHPSAALGYSAQGAYLIWWDQTGTAGQSFSYNKNGGADTVVNMGGTGTIQATYLGTLPAQSGNVVNIHNQTAANAMNIMGILWLTGPTVAASPGFVMIWDAATGQLGEIATSATGQPTDRLMQLAGPTTNAVPSATSGGVLGAAGIPTKLFIVDIWDDVDNILTGQASGAAKTPAQVENPADAVVYNRALGRIRNAALACPADMILSIPSSPSGTTSDVTLPAGFAPQNFDTYLPLWVGMAASRKMALALHGQGPGWGEQSTASGFTTANNPHPTKKGYTDMKNRIYRAMRT